MLPARSALGLEPGERARGRRHRGKDSGTFLRAGAGVSGTQCPGLGGGWEGVTHSLGIG